MHACTLAPPPTPTTNRAATSSSSCCRSATSGARLRRRLRCTARCASSTPRPTWSTCRRAAASLSAAAQRSCAGARAACCVLRAACCVLCAVCCVLRAACCVLRAVCCVLRAACCVLRAVCCVLCAVCVVVRACRSVADMQRGMRVPCCRSRQACVTPWVTRHSLTLAVTRVDNERVVTNRPLAGTRRRGATPEADKALEQELLADEKEVCACVGGGALSPSACDAWSVS
jgi:hypothetical protein